MKQYISIKYLVKTASNLIDVSVSSSVGVVPNQIKDPSNKEGIRVYKLEFLKALNTLFNGVPVIGDIRITLKKQCLANIYFDLQLES
jgi:hypothetical protein